MKRFRLPTRELPGMRRCMAAKWMKKGYELQIKELRKDVRGIKSIKCKDLLDQLMSHAQELLDSKSAGSRESEALALVSDAASALYRSVDEVRESIYINDETDFVEYLWSLLNHYHAYLIDGEVRGLTERARTIAIKY